MADFPKTHKEWEKPLVDLEEGISKLRELARREADAERKSSLETRIADLEKRAIRARDTMYDKLGPWEKVLVARAERRPYTLDYIQAIFHNFVELEGDRLGQKDNAIIGGPAMMDGEPVMIVGHQKGRNIQDRQFRNFGMAKPEGYRKAMRLFDMAERFNIPIITFVDTPAADPGVESESRGISEAIAASMLKMFELTVPTVSIIIGEGGSGGAIGIAASNRVLMLEHSIYSVIPPEGCAAILWRAPERGPDAAVALKLTANSAFEYGLIDEIVEEPDGGAHRDWPEASALIKQALRKHLDEIKALSREAIREHRYAKFRAMGIYDTVTPYEPEAAP
ncbi:MAG: acetyl-CoA carboxylase carboxyltransferase subunit alpha [Fimbriimonas sp.]